MPFKFPPLTRNDPSDESPTEARWQAELRNPVGDGYRLGDMHPWPISRSFGSAATFHQRRPPANPAAEVWAHQVPRAALVLGSTQSESIVNLQLAAEHNLEVCKRNSGGGLLRVQPDDLWLDLILPRTSPLWEDDVGKSMMWLGHIWAETLAALDSRATVSVHSGAPKNREAGKLICFAGMGSGEVEVAGHKVVGISQRRTRTAARFQCLVKVRWTANDLRPYLTPEIDQVAGIDWENLSIGFPDRLRPPDEDLGRLENDFLVALRRQS